MAFNQLKKRHLENEETALTACGSGTYSLWKRHMKPVEAAHEGGFPRREKCCSK